MTAAAVEAATTELQLPRRPTYAKLEWAAKLAPLAGDSKVRFIRVPARLVRRAELTIARSGLGDYLQSQLPAQENRPSGGPKRVLTVDALLVGLVVLALTEQAMVLRDARDLLNNLHPSTKHRLGIPRRDPRTGEGGVTERMVSRLFNQVAEVLDPSPHSRSNLLRNRAAHQLIRETHPGTDAGTKALRARLHRELEAQHREDLAVRLARLRYVLDRGLDATLPDEPHTGSYAVDGTEVESWATQWRKQPRRPELYPDPDARWNGKNSGWYGYWLHGVVRVGEVDGPEGPCFVERIELTAANADVRVAGLELLERMVADHDLADERASRDARPRRDILADPAYTSETNAADDWVWPLFDLGFDSVHRLTEYQLGEWRRKTVSGALIVDGQPASPRMPAHLRNLTPPPVGATRAEIVAYQQLVDQRRPWMLYALGGRHDDGSWDWGCRAMNVLGQVRCDLKPQSMNKPATLKRPTADPALFNPRRVTKELHAVCMQQTARTQASELPFWQKDLYGSEEWFGSWNRRNRVEGLFGNIKNDAAQNITRGRIRVMGLAKVSLMSLFVAMAANLRLADTFAAQQKQKAAEELAAANGVVKQTRKPRFRTQLRHEMRDRIAARQAARQAHDAAGQEHPPPPAPPAPPQVRAAHDPPPPPPGD